MLNAYRQAMELRIPRETSESNYDFCFDSLDGDLGSQRPHDFKTASYPKSHSCVVCHDSIWGIKGGMKCRSCPAEVHIKCAAFIPANCTGAKQMQARPRSTSSASSFMMSPTNTPSPSHTSFLSRADTTASRATTVIPEASSSSTSLQSNTTSPPRTMVFDFQASTELELSVTSGQAVAVLEPDTQGWTKVRDVKSGQEGLVPTSYISSDSVSGKSFYARTLFPLELRGRHYSSNAEWVKSSTHQNSLRCLRSWRSICAAGGSGATS